MLWHAHCSHNTALHNVLAMLQNSGIPEFIFLACNSAISPITDIQVTDTFTLKNHVLSALDSIIFIEG